MEEAKLTLIDALPGRKRLLLGNHDLFPTEVYLRHFEGIYAGFKKYGFWLSHIPIHPAELRGLKNIHGHCHHHTLKNDARYLNCCIEWLPEQRPITLEEVRERFA